MNYRHLFAAIFLPFGALGAEPEVKHVDAKQAAELLAQKKVSVLDVRGLDEYKQGHIAGATLVDFLEDSFKAEVAKLDKTKVWLVHCAAGRRSTAALPVLAELGITQLYHLDGGFSAWQQAGLPVEK